MKQTKAYILKVWGTSTLLTLVLLFLSYVVFSDGVGFYLLGGKVIVAVILFVLVHTLLVGLGILLLLRLLSLTRLKQIGTRVSLSVGLPILSLVCSRAMFYLPLFDLDMFKHRDAKWGFSYYFISVLDISMAEMTWLAIAVVCLWCYKLVPVGGRSHPIPLEAKGVV